MLYTAVTTRPCSKDIAHGPDAIKADLFESIEENPSPPCNAPRSLFPDFFLSIESMNFETRIRAYLPIIANFFLIFQLREGDILSEHSFSFPSATWSRSFPLIVARAANDGTAMVILKWTSISKRRRSKSLPIESTIYSNSASPLALAAAKTRATSREPRASKRCGARGKPE